MKNKISMFLVAAMIFIMSMPLGTASATNAMSSLSDIQGHWAQTTIEQWFNKKFISGNPDGKFKPNSSITRAELVALINRSFGFDVFKEVSFSDVGQKQWFYNDVAKGITAGYVTGYTDGTFKPNQNVSRQEIAVIVSKILKLKPSDSASKFPDTQSLPQWSRGHVGAIIDKDIIKGSKGYFNPMNNSTKAEAVVILDRALKQYNVVYNVAGTYGPQVGTEVIERDVIIDAPGVTLQNIEIKGNLTISSNVGEGDVFLKHVKVTGVTNVNGGGKNSVHFEDSIMVTVVVNKQNGEIRIVANGATVVQELTIQTGARIETSDLTTGEVNEVTLSSQLPAKSQVNLVGKFETVNILAQSIVVELAKGSVSNLNVEASSNQINTDKETSIINLILNAAVQVAGQGKIENATVNATGVALEVKPTSLKLGDSVTKDTPIIIGGTTTTAGDVSTPATSGGGGSGSGGNNGGGGSPVPDTTAPKFDYTNMKSIIESGEQFNFVVDENSTVFLVVGDIPTTKEYIELAIQENRARKAQAIANQPGVIDTTGLAVFSYNLFAEDAAGNRTPFSDVQVLAGANEPLEVIRSSTSDKEAFIYFNKKIFASGNEEELRSSVTSSVYGNEFRPLGVNDAVKIQINRLVVSFKVAFTGNDNTIKIAANTLKDSSGKLLDEEIIIDRIAGKISIQVEADTVNTGESVEFTSTGPTTVYLVRNDFIVTSQVEIENEVINLRATKVYVTDENIGKALLIETANSAGNLPAGQYKLVALGGNSVEVTIQ